MKNRFLIAAALLLVLGAWFVAHAFAQEREDRHSSRESWVLRYLPVDGQPDRDGFQYRALRVDVIDTTGVCVYVTRIWGKDGGTSAIAAVPKSQLPAGTGCQ